MEECFGFLFFFSFANIKVFSLGKNFSRSFSQIVLFLLNFFADCFINVLKFANKQGFLASQYFSIKKTGSKKLLIFFTSSFYDLASST